MTDNPLEGTGDKYSIRSFNGDGSQTNWEFSFDGGYISRNHVKVFVEAADGTITIPTFTWLGDNTINVAPAVVAGAVLTIYRDTPKDDPLVSYSDGSIMSERNLDMSNEQGVFTAAEMADRFSISLSRANEAVTIANSTASQFDDLSSDITELLTGAGIGLDTFSRVGHVHNVATTGLNGFMAAADKVSLNSVVSGLSTLATRVAKNALTPWDFGYTGSGDATSAVQACIDAGVAQYPRAVDLSGTWSVSKITVAGGNGLLLTGVTVLTANSNTAQTCVLDIAMGGVVQTGQIKVSAGYRTNYDRAIWIRGTASAFPQFGLFNSLFCNSAKVGLEIGDATFPSSLVSEITVLGGGTYGCPVSLKVNGTETYVTIAGGQWVSDDFGGDGAWQAMTKRALINTGAFTTVLGGELIMPTSTTNYLIELRPLLGSSGEGTIWGHVSCSNVFVESASPFVYTNINGLTVNSLNKVRGLVSFSRCSGFHSQDTGPLFNIQDFDGRVLLSNNSWWCPITRTQQNIVANSALTDLFIDEASFDPAQGWLNWAYGTTGGTLHFSDMSILLVSGLSTAGVGQVFSTGASTAVFKAIGQAAQHAKFSPNYSTSTGVFTVPTGGLKDVTIRGSLNIPSSVGTIYVDISGFPVAHGIQQGVGQVVEHRQTLAAGDTVSIKVNLTTGGTANLSDFLHYMNIRARN